AAGETGYTGAENVPVTDELTQAAIYAELVRRAACDPDIAEFSFFGFRDDGARAGFQAGLERLDGTLRPAAATVGDAIAATSAGCTARETHWAPGNQVLGVRVHLAARRPAIHGRLSAGEDAYALVCAGRPGSLRGVGLARARRTSECRAASVPGPRWLRLTIAAPRSAR